MSTVIYPYDDSGRAITNLVKNELQVLTVINDDPYRYIIPTFSPFYETNFKLEAKDALGNYTPLVPNVDYNFTLTYIGATRANGAPVWGAINIINQVVQGPVRITYQCLGGKYSADRDYVVRTIAENNYNPRRIAWDQVTSIQELFPPSRHPQDLDTFTGYRDLIDAVNKLAAAPGDNDELRALIWRHILDHDDPHETLNLLGNYVTKEDLKASDDELKALIERNRLNIAENTDAIIDLQNGIVDTGNSFQEQIDANKAGIVLVNERVDDLTTRVDGIDTRVTGNTDAITALDTRLTGDLTDMDVRVNEAVAAVNDVTDLIGRSAAVPDDRVSELLIVTRPHLRFMVWDEATTTYIRAPWHQPAMLQYSYHNPSSLVGYLPVRADVIYEQEDYPDLAAALGLSGTGQFTLVEMRGEFLRVLDNGRGIDVNRVNLSWQKATLVAGYDDNDASGDMSILMGHGFRNYGTDPIKLSDYDISQCMVLPAHETPIVSQGAAPTSWYSATRPRNIAVPLWISY